MKYAYFMVLFFSCSFVVCQEKVKLYKTRPLAVYLESPVFYGFNDGKFPT